MIRAVLDANIFISFLLYPSGDGPPARIVRAALLRRFVPLVSPSLLQEIQGKSTEKPYLARRIAPSDIDEFFTRLMTVGELHDDAAAISPSISRDPKDDYLITNALVYQVDYLVSGDHDLLELGAFEGVRIVSPADFVNLVEQRD